MRHIGTHNLRDAVILLGFKPDDNMVAYLRINDLTDKEQEWLKEAIFKHHKAATLMSQLVHETSRQTGANAGEYFYRRAATCPLRDITLSDRDQCVEWTKGVSNYDPKVPSTPFGESLKGSSPVPAPAPQARAPEPVVEATEYDAGPLAPAALPDDYYGAMVAESVPKTQAPPPQSQLPTNWPAISGVTSAGSDAKLDAILDRFDEMAGQFKSLKRQQKELETAVRTMTRAKKAEGYDVKVLPKLDDGE